MGPAHRAIEFEVTEDLRLLDVGFAGKATAA